MFDCVLVANRGEIAVRIIRACHDLGMRAVAVYSEVDRLAPHVLLADHAVCIGPAAASNSYLRVEGLLEAARATGAGAVHPGYGFLSERAFFAQAVEDAGLVFIGPRPETIQAMGDKTEARRRMRDAGVPIVPGMVEPVADVEAALAAAGDVGFPLLLKAAAGGGGKGMRVVDDAAALPGAFESATREASAAFGDGSVYLERYLDRPRHIEIQVLGDAHGNLVHLGERECSVQRRHQKLVEEAPSPALDDTTRTAMGDAAVRAARAVGYRGAGTVEFLYQDGAFHFLEMNTRIQVEHPVTELVTGLDLVAWQLRVASGERLSFEQNDVRLCGHAIECRITAEDSARGFLPATGTVEWLEVPAGPGVRWDGGVNTGFEVGLHYDPLLGKLIVYGSDRSVALDRLARALDELVIIGVETCTDVHRRLVRDADFRAGELSIRFLEEHPHVLGPGQGSGAGARPLPAEDEARRRAAAVMAALLEDAHRRRLAPADQRASGAASADGRLTAWQTAGWPWRRR